MNCYFTLKEKKVEIQHIFSPNSEREAIISQTESGYNFLVTKTKERIRETDYAIYANTNWDGDKLQDFVSRFKSRHWINDRVLIFAFNDEYKTSNDKIILKNLSSKVIEQIEVVPRDMYFVYDIQPNETVEIPVSWGKYDSLPYSSRCHISAEGYFDDNKGYFDDNTRIPLKLRFTEKVENTESECGNVEVKIFDKEVSFEKTK